MGIERVMELAGHPDYRGLSKDRTTLDLLKNRDKALDKVAPVNFSRELQDNRMADTEEMGFLMKTLDLFARGQYSVVGAYEAYEKGEPILPAAWKGLKGETKGSWIDVMERVIPGRHPWVEIPMGFAGDVIVDPINLVPMAWYGKVGRLLKLPDLLKAADDLTKTTKIMKTVGRKVAEAPAISRQLERFIPGHTLRKVPGAYELYGNLQRKLNDIRRLSRREFIQRWDDFRKVAKGLGQDPNVAAAELIRLRQMGLAEEVLPEYQKHFDDIVEGFGEIAKREVKHGILDEKKLIDDYFPGIYEYGKLVEKGGKLMSKKQTGFFTKMGYRADPFYGKAKHFKTTEEAKKVIHEDWLKGGPLKDIVPVDNWFRGYAIRKMVGESAIAWKQFIDTSLSEFGVKLSDLYTEQLGSRAARAMKHADNIEALLGKGVDLADIQDLDNAYRLLIPKGFSFVTATTNLRSPRMKGMFFKELRRTLKAVEESGVESVAKELGQEDTLFQLFKKMKGRGVIELNPEQAATLVKGGAGDTVHILPSEYAKEIKETFKVFSTDASTKAFIGAMDKAVHMWKSMATSMRWPFHMRNAISNTWQMYLGDVNAAKIPQRLAEAATIQLKTGRKIEGFAAEELLRIADRHGVRAYGWMGGDVPTLAQRELHIVETRGALARKVGVGEQPWNPFQTLSRAGRKFGTGVEDTARLGVFIDQMKKLGITKGAKGNTAKIEKAAAHVRKYLFDYTELTEFERRTMKRLFPFYTWLRKNIPLQLEMVATKPWKYARMGDISTATDHGMQLWPDSAASPTEKQLMRYNWMKEDNFRRTPWTTTNDNPIYAKLDLPPDDLNTMWRLNTWISALTPVWTMSQIGMNVRTWPKVGKLSEPGQKSIAPFYVTWMPNWLHKYAGVEPIRDSRTGKLVLGMDPQWKHALQTAFPFLNDWERAYPQAGSLVAESDQGLYSALSYATGIKFKPFDLTKAAMSQGFRARKAKELVGRAARKRPKLTVKEAKKIFEEVMRP